MSTPHAERARRVHAPGESRGGLEAGTSTGASTPPPFTGVFGGRAFRIGRIAGIDVGVDWTWIFIFLLITFSLARGFAVGDQGWSQAQSWSAGILASLLFFTSIVLHEFGHSLTSMALGLPVHSITLFVFGGLAKLSGEPERPRDEFLIAIAGPAVSVSLGALFLLGALLMPDQPAAADVLGTVLGWLGTVNIAVAVFNLLPGFPLDGGRVFRALVWRLTGDFERATFAAASSGSFLAFTLIGLGILIGLLGGALFNGLWLVLIGWFLHSAARGSTVQVVLQRQLGALRLGPAAEPLEPLVDGGATVQDVIEDVVLRDGRRTVFVRDGDEPVGLVTLHELKQVPRDERGRTALRDVQRPLAELVTAPHDATLWKALELMTEHRVNQLPVERDGRLVGILTREKLLGIVQNAQELDRA